MICPRSVVAGIYNRALHLDERRDALQAWSDHVLRLTGAPPAELEAAPA